MHIDENVHTCPCFPVLQCTPDVETLGPGQLTSVHTFHANAYNHRCQAYNLFSDEASIKTVIIKGLLLLYAALVCRLLL